MLRETEAVHQWAAVFSYGRPRSADTREGHVVFPVFRGAPFRARDRQIVTDNIWHMPELYVYARLRGGARSASARASARAASWSRNLLATVREYDRQFGFVPSPIRRSQNENNCVPIAHSGDATTSLTIPWVRAIEYPNPQSNCQSRCCARRATVPAE
jgi:hypothetical protein